MDNRLVGQKEVAQLIGMSQAWLEQSRFKGKGIPYIKIGRAVRYRMSEVVKWIAEQEAKMKNAA